MYYMFVKIEQRDDNHNPAATSTLYNFYRKYLSNAKSVDPILDSDDIYIYIIYTRINYSVFHINGHISIAKAKLSLGTLGLW